jgi:hypothetical protein
MRELERASKYENRLLFMRDLIEKFTKNLNIKDPKFYSRINDSIKYYHTLRSLSYDKNGLSNFSELVEDYRQLKKSVKVIYAASSYLSSLSNILSIIFDESVKMIGVEKSKSLLRAALNDVKKKYDEHPNLEGYVPISEQPEDIDMGIGSYPVILMDNMISYLVKEMVSKSGGPKSQKVVQPLSKEEIKERLEDVYSEVLGPLGPRQLQKLERLETKEIIDQIESFEKTSILQQKDAQEFKKRVLDILGENIIS